MVLTSPSLSLMLYSWAFWWPSTEGGSVKPRDWCILGMRLLAIYLAVIAIAPLVRALEFVSPLRFTVGALMTSLATAAAALALWRGAPKFAPALLPAAEGNSAVYTGTARDAMMIGLIVTGIGLAATSIGPIVFNLATLLFPSSPDSFGNSQGREELFFLLGAVFEGGVGLLLAVGATRFAARSKISPEMR